MQRDRVAAWLELPAVAEAHIGLCASRISHAGMYIGLLTPSDRVVYRSLPTTKARKKVKNRTSIRVTFHIELRVCIVTDSLLRTAAGPQERARWRHESRNGSFNATLVGSAD